MRQFVSREKFGHMPGAVRTQVGINPRGDLFQLFYIIVFSWNHVGPGFNMNPEFNRLLNRCQHLLGRAHRTDIFVKLVRKTFVTSQGEQQYDNETRTLDYSFLKQTWETGRIDARTWVRHGVSLARAFKEKRNESLDDIWVPQHSPYWNRIQ